MFKTIFTILTILFLFTSINSYAAPPDPLISTFSIVARDQETGELGVAVASKFFAVGSVVPWAQAGVGAVATQSYANTTFGWRGLDLMEKSATPEQTLEILLRTDDKPGRRQVGIVAADGRSVTFTGEECNAWAGGRSGPNYAIQGNILAGESVVVKMEEAFLETEGSLADKLYAALLAGDAEGGDSRGKQSAAILVVKEGAGYGGYTDRAIDIRVDDHAEPFKELGRIFKVSQTFRAWLEGWNAFTKRDYQKALEHQEKAARLAPEHAEVLYDLAVIRLAAGMKREALEALKKSLELNPSLKKQARNDKDFDALRDNKKFKRLMQ